MDPPQTKKQGQKDSKEKRNGFKGLHSGKGVRAITENQSRSKKNKKNTFFNEKIDPPAPPENLRAQNGFFQGLFALREGDDS